ncbi:hypothetical protein FRC11_007180 [Ceratobasidium sp. 423]|nr:hypothetical protein FRC11_007180 [Ceratobasidium sp. 423]
MNAPEPIQPELVHSHSTSSSIKSGKLSHPDAQVETQQVQIEQHKARPPLDYSSFGAFWASVGARIRSVFTRRFILALLGGQLVSICITCTSVTTTELVSRDWALPTTQTFFLYFSLFAVYTPYTIYKYGFKGWANVVIKDGWKYFILAACDGIFICVGGMGMLIASDHLTGTGQYPASSMVKGDLLMLAGATLYGFTNATEEFFVRQRPLYEVVGQLGMYAMIINAIQASGLEHDGMKGANWNGAVIGLLFAYTAAMFILYTTAPLIYRAASSVYYNLSLLSSNFYGLLFALGLYHHRPYWLYFIAFAVIIIGLVAYFWHSTPEEQGKLDPQKPEYVQRKPERDSGSEVPV